MKEAEFRRQNKILTEAHESRVQAVPPVSPTTMHEVGNWVLDMEADPHKSFRQTEFMQQVRELHRFAKAHGCK